MGMDAATIGGELRHAARQRVSDTGWIEGDERLTWAEIDRRADQIACGLLATGLVRGDRIGIIGLNSADWLLLFLGAARVGITVVGMSVRYRDTELLYMANDSAVKVLFCQHQHEGFDFFAMAGRLQPQAPTLRHIVGLDVARAGEPIDFAAICRTPVDAAALARAEQAVEPGDLAMIIYTSGTTGRPKGAGLTQASLLASARAQARHMRIVPGDLYQMAMPLNHVGGITCGVLAFLCGGGTLDLIPEFRVDAVVDRMLRHPPTIVSGVPTMLTLMLMNPRMAEVDLGRARLITSGGSNVDSNLIRQLKQRMPAAHMMNIYGLSETSGGIVMTPWDASEQDVLFSIGRHFADAEMKIIGKDGKPVPMGDVGELCFRGCGTIPGYIGAASASTAFSADGWLHTGDLGLIDERGYIFLKGRAKDMYIQGGFNVYPAEIEDFISRHPKVMMVAGIGVPDPVLGEVGRYYIIPKPGSGLTEAEIIAYCRGNLADYKVPRQIVLRDNLPMTPAGKIQKAALRQEG